MANIANTGPSQPDWKWVCSGTPPTSGSPKDRLWIWTTDGEVRVDEIEWLGEEEFVTPSEEELAGEAPDEPWWLAQRAFLWPTDAEMDRMFSASVGADLALALKN